MVNSNRPVSGEYDYSEENLMADLVDESSTDYSDDSSESSFGSFHCFSSHSSIQSHVQCATASSLTQPLTPVKYQKHCSGHTFPRLDAKSWVYSPSTPPSPTKNVFATPRILSISPSVSFSSLASCSHPVESQSEPGRVQRVLGRRLRFSELARNKSLSSSSFSFKAEATSIWKRWQAKMPKNARSFEGTLPIPHKVDSVFKAPTVEERRRRCGYRGVKEGNWI
ncbi:hypothetical protein L204_100690 [Cryptococcus depauperatus]|nr:hypothetical protein L204_01379 [Cryptococcus depauperatus CBS 7855]